MRLSTAVAVMLVWLVASAAAPAWAVSPDQARSYLESMSAKALAALRSDDDRLAKFGRVVIQGVDFVTISQGALGRVGRRIKGDKLREVADLLAALVVNNAADRLRELAVTEITVGDVKAMPNGDVLVKAEIVADGKESVKMGWRIADRSGSPKIVDIEVEGYSLRINFQNVFERKLRYGGVDGLIRSLRNDVDGTPGQRWVQEAALHALPEPD